MRKELYVRMTFELFQRARTTRKRPHTIKVIIASYDIIIIGKKAIRIANFKILKKELQKKVSDP